MTQTDCTRRYYLFNDSTGRFLETILTGIFELSDHHIHDRGNHDSINKLVLNDMLLVKLIHKNLL